VVIDLPWPKGVTAHNEKHWVKGPHVIHYRFFVGDNKHRDRANMVQMCKAFIDGIADAGGIDGDHWQISWLGTVEVEIRPKNPGVRLEILPKKIE